MEINFKTKCTMNDDGPISGNEHERLESALDEVGRDLEDPVIVDSIIVDMNRKIVQLFKGKIDPFVKGLKKKQPGWKLGTIESQ